MVLRDYTTNDFDGCLKLLQLGHDDDFGARRFEWLHLKNTLAPSRIAVAEDAGVIVGMYAVIKKYLLFTGVRYIGGRDVDPVVHPEYRGRGIFSSLLEYGLRNFSEIDVFFNFANEFSAPGFTKKGWREIGRLKDYTYQVGYHKVMSPRFCLYLLSRLHCNEKNSTDVYELLFNDLVNVWDCFGSINTDRCHVLRDSEYIRWRYHLHPWHTYSYIAVKTGQTITKLAIIRIDEGSQQVVLCDFFYRNESDATIGFLVSYLRKAGLLYKMKIWQTVPDIVRRQFITNVFRSKLSGQPFLVRFSPDKTIPDALHDINRWLVTYGDAEIM